MTALASTEPRRGRPRVRARHVLPYAWLAGLVVLTLPAALVLPTAGLDSSFEVGLSMAFRQHLQWGTQVVYTYGPYEFVDHLVYVRFGTWLLGLGAALGVHLLFFAVLAGYVRALGGAWWHWALATGVLALPLAEFISTEYECMLGALLLLHMAAIASSFRRALLLSSLAGCLLALLILIKGTGMISAAALLTTYGAFVVITRRPQRLVPPLISGAAAFLVLWLLAGQSPAGIGAYVRTSLQVISAYTPGQSVLYNLQPPVFHVELQVAFAVAVLASAGLALVWSILHRDRELACLQLLALPLLFTAYKEGFVRFGERQLFFYALATVIEALVLVRALDLRRPRLRLVPAVQSGVAAISSAALVSGLAFASSGTAVAPVWPAADLGVRLASYRTAASTIADPEQRLALGETSRARIRAQYGLASAVRDDTGTTVDVLPWDISLAYAYGLRWTPRPVLQSFLATLPSLEALDARYFESPAAPQRLLLADETIDNYYFPFQEPAALRAIAASYRVDAQDGPFLVLSRRAQPRPIELRAISTEHAHLGQVVTVPTAGPGPVYAEVSVPYSLRGQLMNLAFQPGELHIAFTLGDGTAAAYRYTPQVGPDGLLVGSYIGGLADLRDYLEGGRSGRSIRSFQIVSDRPGDYSGAVDITFLAAV
ncbi:MAG TPA: hypothetical protein VKF59_17025 [Candidatus Dormibacteraeota bacterium]|nr:hypothetical protein [Candidatus Dormibacteraeota bacterium]